MVYEQHLCLLDNKDRDGEIDLVVNMRHGMSPPTPSPQCVCSDTLSLYLRAQPGALLPLPTAGDPAGCSPPYPPAASRTVSRSWAISWGSGSGRPAGSV